MRVVKNLLNMISLGRTLGQRRHAMYVLFYHGTILVIKAPFRESYLNKNRLCDCFMAFATLVRFPLSASARMMNNQLVYVADE